MRDGTVHELRQDHMRGGAQAPLSAAELEAKFMDNARYGGWSEAEAERLRADLTGLFERAKVDLSEFRH